MPINTAVNIVSHIKELFLNRFQADPLIVRSPGRVNLIGEHTDYNEGFVLPASIDKAAFVAIGPRNDDQFHWIAADLNDEFTGNINALQKSEKGWPNYLMGITEQILKAGFQIKGFN